jgi:hypothetical protein
VGSEKATVTNHDVDLSRENSSDLILLNFLKSSVINNPHSVWINKYFCFRKFFFGNFLGQH